MTSHRFALGRTYRYWPWAFSVILISMVCFVAKPAVMWIPLVLGVRFMLANGYIVFDKSSGRFKEVIRFLWIDWPVTSWKSYDPSGVVHLRKDTMSITHSNEMTGDRYTDHHYYYMVSLESPTGKTPIFEFNDYELASKFLAKLSRHIGFEMVNDFLLEIEESRMNRRR